MWGNIGLIKLKSKKQYLNYFFMTFTDSEYFEVIEKNQTVKDAYELIKTTCLDLHQQTNCPEEDIENFLKFISKQWNK